MPLRQRALMFLAVSSASPRLLAGCGSAAHPSATITASPAPAIVSGTVRIYGGPMLRDGKMAMNGNPMQAVAPLVVKQAGRVFRRATTSAQGRFRLSLPAGTYVISAGCSQPATVVLRVGEIMTRDLACDVP